MSETKFRVGDMVRFKRDEAPNADPRYPIPGRVYTVSVVTSMGIGLAEMPLCSHNPTRLRWWYSDRFELVPDDDNQFRTRSKYDAMKEVFRDITLERDRQDAKFGPHGNLHNMPPFQRLSVLTEEVGELAQALNDMDPTHAREELVQVAAVAVCWLELLEERGVNA